MLTPFTEAGWDELALSGRLPVAALFWADWCLPSRTAFASLAAVASAFTGRLSCGQVDVDGSPALAERHAIRGLPTLIVFVAGKERARRVGLMAREDLRRFLEAVAEPARARSLSDGSDRPPAR